MTNAKIISHQCECECERTCVRAFEWRREWSIPASWYFSSNHCQYAELRNAIEFRLCCTNFSMHASLYTVHMYMMVSTANAEYTHKTLHTHPACIKLLSRLFFVTLFEIDLQVCRAFCSRGEERGGGGDDGGAEWVEIDFSYICGASNYFKAICALAIRSALCSCNVNSFSRLWYTNTCGVCMCVHCLRINISY